MNVSRGLMALSSAAVIAALALCTPASASEPPAKPAAEAMTEVSSKSPVKVRRAWVRKRIVWASRAPRVVMPQEVSWFRPRYERVAVHLPIMLGIGF